MTNPASRKKVGPKSGRERAAAYRARKRKEGMHLVQHWVHDVRAPEFMARVNQQLRELAHSVQEKNDQAFVESLMAEILQDIHIEEG